MLDICVGIQELWEYYECVTYGVCLHVCFCVCICFENMLLSHPWSAMHFWGQAPCSAPSLCFLHSPGTGCGRFPEKLQGLGPVGQYPRSLESVASSSLDRARNLSAVQCPWVAWRNKDTRSLWGGLQSYYPNTKSKFMRQLLPVHTTSNYW